MKKILILFSLFNLLIVFGQCPTSIILTTGSLTTLLSQSGSWIKTTSSLTLTTTVEATSIIKMDANPISGYVELNPGFVASPTSGSFIAQALDGCGSLLPSKIIQNNTVINLLEDNIQIYPNPSKDLFYVRISNIADVNIEVYNVLGVKVLEQILRDNLISEINLSDQASGNYIIKINCGNQIVLRKIIKI